MPYYRELLKDIEMIEIGSAEYPAGLKDISNPPHQLYYMGDPSLLHLDSVAVVGSRKYTVYGKNVAVMIGRRLGECGIPVVSGLALGIDAFAHEGALESGGKVIGVLGSGIAKMGPRKNFDLMMRGVKAGGLVVSEYEPETDGYPGNFPARNRIISGLARSVIVVEARLSSGSLITARLANDQGRSVYAVPGNINSQFSIGSNLLIRDGAYPLIVIDDVIRDLGAEYRPSPDVTSGLDADEMAVYSIAAKYNGVSPDTVAMECGMSISAVSALITVMEIKGILESYGGKVFISK